MTLATDGKRIGKRANNGRKPNKLRVKVGGFVGSRTVVAIGMVDVPSGARQMVSLQCPCGHVTRCVPSKLKRSTVCTKCRGSHVPKPPTRVDGKDARRRDYSRPAPIRSSLGALGLLPQRDCACTWFDGRLVRACGQHRGAA